MLQEKEGIELAKKKIKELNPNFINEYHEFITKYLFRILGISNRELTECIILAGDTTPSITYANKALHFSASNWTVFRLENAPYISPDNMRLARSILDSFFVHAENKRVGSGKNNSLFKDTRKDTIYNMAVQSGICSWIIPGPAAKNAELLFNVLEKWSVKTYEGKKVTFGFVIDPTQISTTNVSFQDWLAFLEDDSSAVLSDCIHSVFELDRECNFLGYHSISNSNSIPSCKLNNQVPLRFSQVIQQYIPKEPKNVNEKKHKVGVFLLNNGDILLIKDGVTRFVRRNLQWLNLSYDAFKLALTEFSQSMYPANQKNLSDALISNVYASVLDVSFAHTGGIISIVGPDWDPPGAKNKPVNTILNPSDNLLRKRNYTTNNNPSLTAAEGVEAREQKETYKKWLHRTMLKNLIGTSKFTELSRKLRSELIAMDGACILALNGNIYSFGAIIQYDSGSTSGGRAAAAKKLSEYGMAVKISTDGYIELYVRSNLVYEVK